MSLSQPRGRISTLYRKVCGFMTRFRTIFAILALGSTAWTSDARATFMYEVAPVTSTTDFGAGSALTVSAFNGGSYSGSLSGTQIINVAQITQTSTTVQPSTDTGSIALAPLIVTIDNLNGGGTGSFTVNGTIIVTRSDTTGAVSSFTPGTITPPTLVLGSFFYTLLNPSYSAPTIGAGGNGNGGLSFTITETFVPEPSSMLLSLLGLPALVLFRRRRAAA